MIFGFFDRCFWSGWVGSACVFAGPRAQETGEKALAVARRLAAMRGARVADGAQADVGPLAGAVLLGAGRVDDELDALKKKLGKK